MLSCYQLKNKLNSQAKKFELILELPDIYAAGLWAVGVYNCSNFYEAHRCIDETYESGGLDSILRHESLQYLIINDFEDSSIVESLHLEVFTMAKRIEQLMLENVGLLKIISTIYEVFGLPDEAKFIVNTGADFRLDWQAYFNAQSFPLDVRYADVTAHGTCFRLIATKCPFEDLSLSNIKKYISFVDSQLECRLTEISASERSQFMAHVSWLIKTYEHFHKEADKKATNSPRAFRIDGSRYYVSGFPLTSSLIPKSAKPLLKLNVKNVSGEQKFIVKIDQQALIFCIHRFDDILQYNRSCKQYSEELKSGVLSHWDAATGSIDIDENSYLSYVRPLCLQDEPG